MSFSGVTYTTRKAYRTRLSQAPEIYSCMYPRYEHSEKFISARERYNEMTWYHEWCMHAPEEGIAFSTGTDTNHQESLQTLALPNTRISVLDIFMLLTLSKLLEREENDATE
jgi:hypothetical protein